MVAFSRRTTLGSLCLVAVLMTVLPGSAHADGIWHPAQGSAWQWQLSGQINFNVNAKIYDIDMFENGSRAVNRLHSKGRKAICYISAGSFEDWRPDAGKFPASVKGRSNGWSGERWLDIRKLAILRPIMRARMDKCAARGYDGIEFDNVDGYVNHTGWPLTGSDQRRYDRWLAEAAHHRSLAAGLKNDLPQVARLEPHFEFAVNEQCFQYHECGMLKPFIDAGKAVFQAEYSLGRWAFCSRARYLGFSSMRKHLSLGVWRHAC